MSLAALITCVALFVAEPSAVRTAGAETLRALQGPWTVAYTEVDGNHTLHDPLAGLTLVVSDNRLTVLRGDTVIARGQLRLDCSHDPKTVDVTITEGQGKGKTFVGILEAGGPHVVICSGAADKQPTEFVTDAGSGRELRFFLRVPRRGD